MLFLLMVTCSYVGQRVPDIAQHISASSLSLALDLEAYLPQHEHLGFLFLLVLVAHQLPDSPLGDTGGPIVDVSVLPDLVWKFFLCRVCTQFYRDLKEDGCWFVPKGDGDDAKDLPVLRLVKPPDHESHKLVMLPGLHLLVGLRDFEHQPVLLCAEPEEDLKAVIEAVGPLRETSAQTCSSFSQGCIGDDSEMFGS